MTAARPEGGFRASAFPPIAEYALLSDCETTALIAPNGNVEWMCLPRMDSPSVFASILDRDAGSFRLGPAHVNVPAARRYIPGTMVLETSWETRTGWVIVRDVLSIGPWHHDDEPALLSALRNDAGYIGALGSRKTAADREARLRRAGVGDAEIARIHAPCGLDIGSRTAEETAVSVLGEIIAVRAGRVGEPLREPGGRFMGDKRLVGGRSR